MGIGLRAERKKADRSPPSLQGRMAKTRAGKPEPKKGLGKVLFHLRNTFETNAEGLLLLQWGKPELRRRFFSWTTKQQGKNSASF
jgi:hypothetical protein